LRTEKAVNRRLRPEIIVFVLLLLIPIGAAAYFFLPAYHQFSAMGQIVPVRDIGIAGSVHFTYVSEGYTRNLYERIGIKRNFPDAEFTPADASENEFYAEAVEAGEEARNETIRNAIMSADKEAEQHASEEQLEERLRILIEETSTYYGDSIGLMVAIGLAEESRHADFSRGGQYVIAGTGTLEEDFSVGSVGSIRNKLRTAERAGADVFFVPRDREYFWYEGLSNEEEAELVADELHLRVRVVPVASLEEALDFLDHSL